MSEEFWEKALTELDDKYIKEAAELLMENGSENSNGNSEASFTEATVVSKNKTPKRSRKKIFITLGGIAAAFAIAVPAALNLGLFNLTQKDDDDSFLNTATLPYSRTGISVNSEELPAIDPADIYNSISNAEQVPIPWQTAVTENYAIRIETPYTYTYRIGDTTFYSGQPTITLNGINSSSCNVAIVGETQMSVPYLFTDFTTPELYVWDVAGGLLIMVKCNYTAYPNETYVEYFEAPNTFSFENDRAANFFYIKNGEICRFNYANTDTTKMQSYIETISDSFKVVGNRFIDLGKNIQYTFNLELGTVAVADYADEMPSYLEGTINRFGGVFEKEEYDKYFLGEWSRYIYGAYASDAPRNAIEHESSSSLPTATYIASDETGIWLTDYNDSIYFIPYANTDLMFFYSGSADNWNSITEIDRDAYHAVYILLRDKDTETIKDETLLKNVFSGVWEYESDNGDYTTNIIIGKTFDEKLKGVLIYDAGTLLISSGCQGYYVANDQPDKLYYYEGLPRNVTKDFDITSASYHSVYRRVRNENVAATKENDYYLNDEVISLKKFTKDYETLKTVFMGEWGMFEDTTSFNYSRGTPGFLHFTGVMTTEFGWWLNENNGGCGSLFFVPFSNPNIMYCYIDAAPAVITDYEYSFDKTSFNNVYHKSSSEYETKDLGSYGLELLLGEKDYSILYDMWSQPEAVLPNGKIYERVRSLYILQVCKINTKVQLISLEENKIVFEQPFYRPLTLEASAHKEDAYDYIKLQVTIEKDKNGDWWVTRVESPKDLNTEYFTPGITPVEAVMSYYLRLNSPTDIYIDNDATVELRARLKNSAELKTSMNWTDEFIDSCVCAVTALHNPSLSTSVPIVYTVVKNELMNEWYVLPDGWDTVTTSRPLSQEELDRTNEAFKPTFYDEATNIRSTNPATIIFNEYFSTPIEIDIRTVAERYPYDRMKDDERYQIVRKSLG